MFAWGNPLCESTSEKRKETADEFVGWGKEKGWKVIWCCVDSEFEKVLAEGVAGVRWSTLSCREEDVLREWPMLSACEYHYSTRLLLP